MKWLQGVLENKYFTIDFEVSKPPKKVPKNTIPELVDILEQILKDRKEPRVHGFNKLTGELPEKMYLVKVLYYLNPNLEIFKNSKNISEFIELSSE